jgi:S-adenosylmethionine:tRNA ribosyltransferase-isomerase
MDLGVLDYALDPALIAQEPLETRDASRMMVVERASGSRTHAAVRDLGSWLRAGDVLVANDAEVIAARLHGSRPTGGAIEVLLVEPLDAQNTWRCIARGAGKTPAGEVIHFGTVLRGVWGERTNDVYRSIRLECDGDLTSALEQVGELPLPPYIQRPNGPSSNDRTRYQTMFARKRGAIAAPTAGLHFTPELMHGLLARGVIAVTLTLMVGPATFLPVRTTLAAHTVPAERYTIPAATAAAIALAREGGHRVVAVGTTTARALETVAAEDGVVRPAEGRTDLVIGPGHTFRAVDALLTNFHLPRSSLLALVAAFAGTERTLAAYREAASAGYRFYSYGDAMLIL